jgi:hypothetical protein
VHSQSTYLCGSVESDPQLHLAEHASVPYQLRVHKSKRLVGGAGAIVTTLDQSHAALTAQHRQHFVVLGVPNSLGNDASNLHSHIHL